MEANFCASRRALLKSTCGLIAVSAFGAGGEMPKKKDPGAPLVGDTFVFGDGPNKGNVVFLKDLVVGAHPVVAQAQDPVSGTPRESEHSTVLLMRMPPEKVPEEVKEDAAQGVLAYSAVCTHLGCTLTDWVEEKKLIQCPCHGATFDPMQAGKWAGDGPKSRTLPILPLKVAEDGKLVVADVFTGPVGPKKG